LIENDGLRKLILNPQTELYIDNISLDLDNNLKLKSLKGVGKINFVKPGLKIETDYFGIHHNGSLLEFSGLENTLIIKKEEGIRNFLGRNTNLILENSKIGKIDIKAKSLKFASENSSFNCLNSEIETEEPLVIEKNQSVYIHNNY
jgi:hypothetical protein